MKKLSVLLLAMIYIVLTGCATAQPEKKNDVPYIATVNGVALPLDEYFIYLRTEVLRFEETGGADIWRVPIGGVPSIEVAKNNALEVMVAFEITVSQSDVLLPEAERTFAENQAKSVWETFKPWEQEKIPLSAVENVLKTVMRSDLIQAELTQNYNENERENAFQLIFDDLRTEATVVRNSAVWDAIVSWEEGENELDVQM